MSPIYVIASGLLLAAAIAPADSPAQPTTSSEPITAPIRDGEVQQLILDLGDPAYEKRTFATRRLVAVGMEARPAILNAAEGDDLERALRARRIVEILDSVYFAGCEIRLEFKPAEARWDEPVDLILEIHNHSPYTARVPFDLLAPPPTSSLQPDALDQQPNHDAWPESKSAPAAATQDARQVGDMLDLAEWLTVLGADGRTIDLRVDEIAADPQVMSAVQQRLETGPVSTLTAGETRKIKIPAFNRGWARYPLLEAGEHSVVFEYVPPWTDAALADAKVGRAVSNMANLMIKESAPAEVSRTGATASVSVERRADAWVASITNHSDLPLVINQNFGPGPPFALCFWEAHVGQDVRRIPAARSNPTWSDFSASKLAELGPGRKMELARIEFAEVQDKLRAEEVLNMVDSKMAIRFSYLNALDRAWQLRESLTALKDPNLPQVLREPLPRRLVVLHQTSDPVPVSGE